MIENIEQSIAEAGADSQEPGRLEQSEYKYQSATYDYLIRRKGLTHFERARKAFSARTGIFLGWELDPDDNRGAKLVCRDYLVMESEHKPVQPNTSNESSPEEPSDFLKGLVTKE